MHLVLYVNKIDIGCPPGLQRAGINVSHMPIKRPSRRCTVKDAPALILLSPVPLFLCSLFSLFVFNTNSHLAPFGDLNLVRRRFWLHFLVIAEGCEAWKPLDGVSTPDFSGHRLKSQTRKPTCFWGRLVHWFLFLFLPPQAVRAQVVLWGCTDTQRSPIGSTHSGHRYLLTVGFKSELHVWRYEKLWLPVTSEVAVKGSTIQDGHTPC